MGNSSSLKFNMKKEDPYKEIYYGPDPCYLLNTNYNSSVAFSRKKTINDGNPTVKSSRRLFNNYDVENKENPYGLDPCYLPSTNSNSAPLSRNKLINDGNHSRFKSRSLPPIPLDKTEDAALSYLNYYDAIAENLESKNQNSKAMVPKEQIFNINVIFESKNVSRCPSVSTESTVLSSRRNSTVKTENGPRELNFEEPISTEDTYIMKFTGFLADV